MPKHGPLPGTPDVRENPGEESEGAFHSCPSVPGGSRAPTGPGTQSRAAWVGDEGPAQPCRPKHRGVQGPSALTQIPHLCVCVYACMCWHTCALRTHVFIF